MTLHQVEYAYMVPEWSSMDINMDPDLTMDEKEAIALVEIKNVYDDISDIEILKIKTVA